MARRQADQIYNLSLTQTATVTLGRAARKVTGIGRVKTPTLAIQDFMPVGYFEMAAMARTAGGAGLRGAARRARGGQAPASTAAARPALAAEGVQRALQLGCVENAQVINLLSLYY